MTDQTLTLIRSSKLYHRLGQDRFIDRLPALDRNMVYAHIARELGLEGDQAQFIRRVIALLEKHKVPSRASFDERIEAEPLSFRERLRIAKRVTARFRRSDILIPERYTYLTGRVELCSEILRLSCFAPYYSQFGARHSFGSDSAIRQMLRVPDSEDDFSSIRTSEFPADIERKLIYIAAMGDLILMGEKACVHEQIQKSSQEERNRHVYIPSLVYLVRMAAEYSVDAKMPEEWTVDRAQEEISAKIQAILATAKFGETVTGQIALNAIDVCLSNGDYAQGIKIAQIYNLFEPLAIMRELEHLVSLDVAEVPPQD